MPQRRFLIAGNWKMHLNRAGSVSLAKEIARRAGEVTHTDLVVCPPAVYLDAVGQALGNAPVALGAQNMYHQPEGAFTGEISGAMLADITCRFVILGHSERRHVMGETDHQVNQKLHAALSAGLAPIVCVGELLQQRERGETSAVIHEQTCAALAGVTAEQMASTVIAYEPVWAIGTGKVATPETAEEVHADLRKLIGQQYNASIGENVRIVYGGSVKPDNAGPLLQQENIDGALVGGASLKAGSFIQIAAAASAT